MNANLQENLSGVRVTQAYGRQGRNTSSFRDSSSANPPYISTDSGSATPIVPTAGLPLIYNALHLSLNTLERAGSLLAASR